MFRFQVKIRDLKTTNFDVQIQESPAKSDSLKVKYIADGSRFFFFNHLELIISIVTACYFVIAVTASGVWGEEKRKARWERWEDQGRGKPPEILHFFCCPLRALFSIHNSDMS